MRKAGRALRSKNFAPVYLIRLSIDISFAGWIKIFAGHLYGTPGFNPSYFHTTCT